MKKITSLLIALAVLAGGIFIIVLGFKTVGKHNSYQKTTAVISDIQFVEDVDGDNTYNVIVEYKADEKDYKNELGEYSASMAIGNEIEILYNPRNPLDIVSAGIGSIIAYFAFGIVAVIASIILGLKTLAR